MTGELTTILFRAYFGYLMLDLASTQVPYEAWNAGLTPYFRPGIVSVNYFRNGFGPNGFRPNIGPAPIFMPMFRPPTFVRPIPLNHGRPRAEENESELPKIRRDCEGDSSCPTYHYCSDHLRGSFCASHLNKRGKDCQGQDGQPDHSKCSQDPTSTEQCFFAKGQFKCSKGYYMPCNPSDPKGCPSRFKCQPQTFKGGVEVPVCVPIEPAKTGHSCKSDFDCGFNKVFQHWSGCNTHFGFCGHLVE